MRRLIAYITMALSMLLAIGVAATPVLTKLNSGREFSEGREIVYKIESINGEQLEEDAAENVAKEMRTRLDNFNIEDYSIKVQGDDTITASFAVEKDSFNYIARYLCFSGEDFAISGVEETSLKNEKDLFKMDEAKIVYEQDTIPVIVIPVTDYGKESIESLVNELSSTEEGNTEKAAPMLEKFSHDEDGNPTEGEEETPESTPDMYLWANYEEGDSLAESSEDPLIREKILMSFYSSNIWYEKSKEEKTEISFVCGRATEDNQYDLSGLKDANVMAKFLLNMLQASKYDYVVECPTRNVTKDGGVDYFENSTLVEPSYENLLTYSSNVYVAFSTTLVATLIALVIVSLLLVVYYRINAIAAIATTIGTLFLTIVSFSTMSVLFNLPAIIGLLILASASLFGEIVYLNRFKEEVYKGRTLKKANHEASKKSNLLTLDASIILAFSGLMMYVLGGTALKPLGVVLFFGAIIGLLMNLIVFKILMYFVTNSSNLQSNYKAFNIDESKVPSLINEQKPVYEGAYEKTDFTKRKKLSGIIIGALSVAAVAVITIFGIKDGSPLNVKNATKDTTVIYTQLKEDNLLINDVDTFKEYALKNLSVDGENTIAPKSVDMKKVTVEEFDGSETSETKTLYFIVKIDSNYSEEDLKKMQDSISESLDSYSINLESIISIEAKTSNELVYTPSQGYVALATGLSIVGAALYVCFRFRASRGLSMLITTTASTAIAYGIMVGARIGTTAITSVAMPVVALTMMLASLFYFSTEKAMLKDAREQLTMESRKEIMIKSLGKAASPTLVFFLLTIYIAINYFGFGLTQTAFLFASVLVGEIVSVIAVLTIQGPLALAFEKLLSKIRLPKFKLFEKKQQTSVPKKRNSSEPEETIFIGIND